MKDPVRQRPPGGIPVQRVERIMAIHRVLKGGRRCTATELARDLGVHVRTVYRDVEFLRDRLGAPVQALGTRGYSYSDPSYSLPDFTLTEGELLAFLVAERVVEGYAGSGAPFLQRMREGLQKLAKGLGRDVTVALDDLHHRRYQFESGPLRQVRPEFVGAVHRAMASKQTMVIRYHAITGDGITEREIEPYHLVNHRGDWYLVARCRLRGDMRTFSLSRVLECREGTDTYQVPRDFDPQTYFQSALSIFRGSEVQEVRVYFSPLAARWIVERTWHPSQRVERGPDGSAVLTLTVAPTVEVVHWILAHGREARVLSPPSLAEKVHEEIQAMSALYGEGGSARAEADGRPVARELSPA